MRHRARPLGEPGALRVRWPHARAAERGEDITRVEESRVRPKVFRHLIVAVPQRAVLARDMLIHGLGRRARNVREGAKGPAPARATRTTDKAALRPRLANEERCATTCACGARLVRMHGCRPEPTEWPHTKVHMHEPPRPLIFGKVTVTNNRGEGKRAFRKPSPLVDVAAVRNEPT